MSIKEGLKEDLFETSMINLKNIKRSNFINRGHDYNVYNTNYPDFVLRVKRGKIFNVTKNLKRYNDSLGLVYAQNDDESVQLMKKVSGEPLYGNGWTLMKDVDPFLYFKALRKIIRLPDKTFEDYIKKVLYIRKNGYDIDRFNPNNFLLDNETINIVDLSKTHVEPKISIEDFYPFFDEKILGTLLFNLPKESKDELITTLRNFLARIVKICRRNGQNVEIEKVDHSKLQNFVTYVYYGDKYALDRLI